ncbi:MAG: ABC transporter permease [Planctomycetota bacterium]|nr:ABC transporter permease [Planctomycetota bacterium]
MNRFTLKGLFLDALYQVLDNLGFRILLILFLVPVAMSFLVSFGEQEVSFLWAWDLRYVDLIPDGFGSGSGGAMPNPGEYQLPPGFRDSLLQTIATTLIDQVADKFGLVFGIAAISFYVPQMLERGAADVVFSKPVSRMALFLSRYVAGLIFVGVLALVLVGGTSLGLAVSSQYFDPGLLWSIVTLVYGFAIFHAISCTIGVFTRNSIASILLTLVFMPVNCGLHKGWESIVASERQEADYYARHPDKTPAIEEDSAAYATLRTGLTVYHVLAPKSRDATRIAQGWRKGFEPIAEFRDEDLGLEVLEPPAGFRREPRSSFEGDGLEWLAAVPEGSGEARWTLRSQDMEVIGTRSSLVKKLRKELSVDPVRSDISGRYTDRFEWVEDRGGEKRLRRRWVFQINSRILTLDYDAEATWARTPEQETAAQKFVASIQIEDALAQQMSQADYDSFFGWTAPWQFNAWFSVGTTIAFIVAVLALGIAKLKRIDF